MTKKVRSLVILDRELPSDHSFIRGFIIDKLVKKNNSLIIALTNNSMWYKNNQTKTPYKLVKKVSFKIKTLKHLIKFLYIFNRLYEHRNNLSFVYIRNNYVALLICRILRLRKKGIKIYFQISNLHAETILDGYSVNPFKRFVAKISIFLRPHLLNHVDYILPVSDWMSKYLTHKHTLNVKHFVLPLGITSSDFINTQDSNRDIDFIYVGTINKLRKINDLVHSFVTCNFETERLMIISSENASHKSYIQLKKMISQTKCEKIILYPRMERIEMIKYLNRSKFAISHIPPIKSLRQVSPTKLMEYMASSCVVIGYKGIPEQDFLIKKSECGYLIEYDDESLTKKMIELSKINYSDFKSMRIKGKNTIHQIRDYKIIYKKFETEILNKAG